MTFITVHNERLWHVYFIPAYCIYAVCMYMYVCLNLYTALSLIRSNDDVGLGPGSPFA